MFLPELVALVVLGELLVLVTRFLKVGSVTPVLPTVLYVNTVATAGLRQLASYNPHPLDRSSVFLCFTACGVEHHAKA